MSQPRGRTLALTTAALTGFAANSLLCRAALGAHTVDATTFTAVRLGSGALALAVLARLATTTTATATTTTRATDATTATAASRPAGSWPSALALFAYAIAFSFAYLRLPAGTGALLLFGAVQATMIGWGVATGERPRATEWLGLALALGGLVTLTLPGVHAPDVAGAALMLGAGVAWGVYSLRGRGVTRPLAATADNFLRSVPFALVAVGAAALGVTAAHASARGVALAVASGALASGVGYSLWYAALAGLTAARAGIVQLAVPLLAASGGALLLHEVVGVRLIVACGLILGGVTLATTGR